MFYTERRIGDIRGTFFEKCYICERLIDIGGQQEHRIPKSANKSDKNLRDESNIFLACSRCNLKKLDGYWKQSKECRYSYGFIGIIDCTKCDPNKYIKMKIGDYSDNYKITLTKKADAPCIDTTLSLLNDIYGIEISMEDIDLERLKNIIINEVCNFNYILRKLFACIKCKKNGEEINICKEDVIKLLLPNSPFSAFKRTCIEEAYEIQSNDTLKAFKDILKEILDDPRLNPTCEVTKCSVI